MPTSKDEQFNVITAIRGITTAVALLHVTDIICPTSTREKDFDINVSSILATMFIADPYTFQLSKYPRPAI